MKFLEEVRVAWGNEYFDDDLCPSPVICFQFVYRNIAK